MSRLRPSTPSMLDSRVPLRIMYMWSASSPSRKSTSPDRISRGGSLLAIRRMKRSERSSCRRLRSSSGSGSDEPRKRKGAPSEAGLLTPPAPPPPRSLLLGAVAVAAVSPAGQPPRPASPPAVSPRWLPLPAPLPPSPAEATAAPPQPSLPSPTALALVWRRCCCCRCADCDWRISRRSCDGSSCGARALLSAERSAAEVIASKSSLPTVARSTSVSAVMVEWRVREPRSADEPK
mmetsp:Transcript_22747/g.66944  ORF Transcript_22747/g.66944 Transcript_22747/m.66944 type:complete len:235 (-) Transcript_22747:1587-2291(-)